MTVAAARTAIGGHPSACQPAERHKRATRTTGEIKAFAMRRVQIAGNHPGPIVDPGRNLGQCGGSGAQTAQCPARHGAALRGLARLDGPRDQ